MSTKIQHPLGTIEVDTLSQSLGTNLASVSFSGPSRTRQRPGRGRVGQLFSAVAHSWSQTVRTVVATKPQLKSGWVYTRRTRFALLRRSRSTRRSGGQSSNCKRAWSECMVLVVLVIISTRRCVRRSARWMAKLDQLKNISTGGE